MDVKNVGVSVGHSDLGYSVLTALTEGPCPRYSPGHCQGTCVLGAESKHHTAGKKILIHLRTH